MNFHWILDEGDYKECTYVLVGRKLDSKIIKVDIEAYYDKEARELTITEKGVSIYGEAEINFAEVKSLKGADNIVSKVKNIFIRGMV